MANPTSGFQLSALPQPLSIPTNIGTVDVGQMQNAYKNAMQAVQDTALFGQRLQQQKALLDYQTGKAQQQFRLLSPEENSLRTQYAYEAGKAARDLRLLPEQERTLRQQLGADYIDALLRSKTEQQKLPYAEVAGRAAAATAAQKALTEAESAKIGADIYGAPLIEQFINAERGIAPQAIPSQPLAPAPTAVPSGEVTTPAAGVEVTPVGRALGSFTQAPAAPVSAVQTAPAPASVSALQTFAQPQVQQPAGEFQKVPGGYLVNNVTIPERSMQSNVIQDLIRQGFIPSGNARNWILIDRQNRIQRTANITPSGEIKLSEPASFDATRQKAIQTSEQATTLAQQIDPNYQQRATEPANIADAAKIFAKSTVQNENQKYPAVNPMGGISDPIKAADALKKARDAALTALDNDRAIINDISKVRYSLNEFRDLNAKIPTGPLAETVAAKYLSWGGQIEDFIKQLKDDKERSFVSDNADTLNRMRIIHNEVIPGLVRSMNPRLNVTAGTQAGGVTGLGRIMFNEIPWLSSGSPNVGVSGRVNMATIESALSSMDKVQDLANYRDAFFNDYGHLQGSTQNFNKYEARNPYYIGGKINNDRQSWTEGLMSQKWREENGDAPKRTYANVFSETKQTAPVSVDVKAAPRGLSKEDFVKWLTSQRQTPSNND